MNVPPVPLTIQTPLHDGYSAYIVIGSEELYEGPTKSNLYWIVVVNNNNLKVEANFTFSNNAEVPSELSPYLNDPTYTMILSTVRLNSNNLPQGAFHAFLVSEGAGRELARMEQIFEAFNCGTWGVMSYNFVAVLGSNPVGYEFFNLMDPVLISTLQFEAVEVENKTTYAPVLV